MLGVIAVVLLLFVGAALIATGLLHAVVLGAVDIVLAYFVAKAALHSYLRREEAIAVILLAVASLAVALT